MFSRPERGERAIIVHIQIHSFTNQPSLEEFVELVRSAGVTESARIVGSRHTPEPGTFVGQGKLEEITAVVQAHQAEVVLFNHELTPVQERNLERAFQCRVVDRTGVILDIFAQRARSFEGKLQVELAQLEHFSTRLIRGWTHLERQRGGIGLRGPGETQLETDRRLLAERIKHIRKQLEKVGKRRELNRRTRRRAELPVVSLVGYTNAGKSTLFNRLTDASVYVADQLFATLDPTLRRVELSDKQVFILVDTVGFIQQLPYQLVAAFRATLEESRQATLLLHVVDASDAGRQTRITQVNQILQEIGADTVPQLLIYNKIDFLENVLPHSEYDEVGHTSRIWLSALTGSGIELLTSALAQRLDQGMTHCWVKIPVTAGHVRSRFFTNGIVLQEKFDANGDSLLEIQMQTRYFNQLLKTETCLQPIDKFNEFFSEE